MNTVVVHEELGVETPPPPFDLPFFQPPDRIFIVPYRNRVEQKFFFQKYMTYLLEDQPNFELYFSHQCDVRSFNRGAMKNLGFLAMREKYPHHYRDITFVFNDVDTVPFTKLFAYDTVPGVVKHYYGTVNTLGGIVVIKGGDFERVNGFPCYWGWGMEDNALQKRCERWQLHIDRSHFYPIGSPEILQLFDGVTRLINRQDPYRERVDNGVDGLSTIRHYQYTIDKTSTYPKDQRYDIQHDRMWFLNVKTFLTLTPFLLQTMETYDLRSQKRPIVNYPQPQHLQLQSNLQEQVNDWSNIPYHPTTQEQRIALFQYYQRVGMPVPSQLVQDIQHHKQEEETRDMAVPYVSVQPHLPQSHLQPPPQPLQQMGRGGRGGGRGGYHRSYSKGQKW